MRRTDALTAFLSGVSLLILGPVFLILFLQWWMILLIALAITGFAVWAVLQKNKEDTYPVGPASTSNPGLSPEVVQIIKQTLAEPYCSRCGVKFDLEAASFCSQCGEQRSFKPISTLLDVDAE